MIIFETDKETGISCGINDDGDLFLDNGKSGYNLPDTRENMQYLLLDFERLTGIRLYM